MNRLIQVACDIPIEDRLRISIFLMLRGCTVLLIDRRSSTFDDKRHFHSIFFLCHILLGRDASLRANTPKMSKCIGFWPTFDQFDSDKISLILKLNCFLNKGFEYFSGRSGYEPWYVFLY